MRLLRIEMKNEPTRGVYNEYHWAIDAAHPSREGWAHLPTPRTDREIRRNALSHEVCACTNEAQFALWWPDRVLTRLVERDAQCRVVLLECEPKHVAVGKFQALVWRAMASTVNSYSISEFLNMSTLERDSLFQGDYYGDLQEREAYCYASAFQERVPTGEIPVWCA